MMILVDSKTIAQMARPLLPADVRLEPERRIIVEQAVSEFIMAQIAAMPVFLRLPYQLAIIGFNWLAFLRFGRPFVRLDVSKQNVYMYLWANSPLRLMRDFVKLIRSLALLQYLDHPLTLEELDRCAERGME